MEKPRKKPKGVGAVLFRIMAAAFTAFILFITLFWVVYGIGTYLAY